MKYLLIKKIVPNELDQQDIVYKYQQMYQLSYNNKSEVLAEDESLPTKISELILYDPNGNSPTLQGGEIVRGQTNSITYRVSADAFNAASPNTFYYEVLYNELSQGAVIAKTNLTGNEYSHLTTDYNRRVNDILPGSEDAVPSSVRGVYQRTSTSNWTNNQVSFTLRVYSEIYIKDPGIGLAGDKYYTDYTVYIIKSTTNLTMNATINLNHTNSTHNAIGTSLTINDRQMPPTGHLNALFVGNSTAVNNLMPNHHEMTIHNLYLGSVHVNNMIDPEFYELELIKKGLRFWKC